MFHRKNGEEQPYWPAGPFKIRMPFVHYRWEFVEMAQALIMFVVSLAMIPGWITPGIPVVLLFLSDYEPGPEAIQALFALQFLVFIIFLFLGVTRLGSKLVDLIPRSMKGGIIIGAGIAALMGEIEAGGRLATTPISLIVGGLVCLYLMFSVSFKGFVETNSFARKIANYGMVPGMIVAILVGFATGEYAVPDAKRGITTPNFGELWNYLPFSVGFPDASVFMYAIPTAVIAYVIAFGDIVVGQSLMNRVDHLRRDEDIDNSIDRVHLVTAIRNGGHAFFAPSPGLAGPIWTAVTNTMACTMGVVLAVYGAGWGLATGAVLYFLIERTKLLGFTPDPDSPGADDVIVQPETIPKS
jgi:hypothetical protein